MALSRQEMIREANASMTTTFALLRAKRTRASLGCEAGQRRDARRRRRTTAAARGCASESERSPAHALAARNEYLTRQRIETEVDKQRVVREADSALPGRNPEEVLDPVRVRHLRARGLAARHPHGPLRHEHGDRIEHPVLPGLLRVPDRRREARRPRASSSPFLAMWAPNLVFGALLDPSPAQGGAASKRCSDWTSLSVLRSLFRRHATANPR